MRLAYVLVSTIVIAGGAGLVASPSRAGEMNNQGVILTWDDNSFIDPAKGPGGCSTYTMSWSNNSGRRFLAVDVTVANNLYDFFFDWVVGVDPGASGEFSEQICARALDRGLGPYTLTFTVDAYTTDGGGVWTQTAPLTFLASAPPPPPPPPAPDPAPDLPVQPSPPTKPRNFAVSIKGTTATLEWDAPAEVEASTRFIAKSLPEGKTCETAELRCEIRGLTRGKRYRFTLVAVSDAGTSPRAVSRVFKLANPPAPRPARPTAAPRPTAPPQKPTQAVG